MSTPPQETETYTVDLSTTERWVAHHVLTRRADEVIDQQETPPEWLFALVEAIEDGTETITYRQARTLHDELTAYAGADDTPARDVDPAAAVTDRLEAKLES